MAKFYELVGFVFGLLGLGILVCGVTAWVKVFGGDLEEAATYGHIATILDYLEDVVLVIILLLGLHLRRTWVARYGTGEDPITSCLISWFCCACNYGQLGSHKDSQPNVVVV